MKTFLNPVNSFETLKIAYILEGIFIPENKGPMLFYYWGISGGKKNELDAVKTSIDRCITTLQCIIATPT